VLGLGSICTVGFGVALAHSFPTRATAQFFVCPTRWRCRSFDSRLMARRHRPRKRDGLRPACEIAWMAPASLAGPGGWARATSRA
jgi:hypothetical protein